MMIAAALGPRLPGPFFAEPQVQLGSVEVDVATFEGGEDDRSMGGERDDGGGVAVAAWAPPRPTLTVVTGLGRLDKYEVRVYDEARGRRLVAAVEIVSPANKDRPERRRAFVVKCAALLQEGVCVAIVDIVTSRSANLYGEILDHLGLVDPSMSGGPPDLYAVACRFADAPKGGRLEVWAYPLAIGRDLPILPLWLAPDLVVPLELEASYEETCRLLRIA